MNIAKLLLAVVALAAALSQASCIVRPRRVHEVTVVRTDAHAEVTVGEAPPAPRVEVVPAAPSLGHVWVGGYWARDGSAWTWVPGVHVVRPAHRNHWEPGHWVVRGNRWLWIPGRWA